MAVYSGVRADHKDIHLDGGSDQLTVDRRYPGRITARLGVGSDDYWNDRSRAGVRVYGEDSMTGAIGDDDLRGGTGTDGADGRHGDDLCRAEKKTRCER